jgi:hypothetical protein
MKTENGKKELWTVALIVIAFWIAVIMILINA